MTGRVHPVLDDLARGREAAGRPGEVLADVAPARPAGEDEREAQHAAGPVAVAERSSRAPSTTAQVRAETRSDARVRSGVRPRLRRSSLTSCATARRWRWGVSAVIGLSKSLMGCPRCGGCPMSFIDGRDGRLNTVIGVDARGCSGGSARRRAAQSASSSACALLVRGAAPRRRPGARRRAPRRPRAAPRRPARAPPRRPRAPRRRARRGGAPWPRPRGPPCAPARRAGPRALLGGALALGRARRGGVGLALPGLGLLLRPARRLVGLRALLGRGVRRPAWPSSASSWSAAPRAATGAAANTSSPRPSPAWRSSRSRRPSRTCSRADSSSAAACSVSATRSIDGVAGLVPVGAQQPAGGCRRARRRRRARARWRRAACARRPCRRAGPPAPRAARRRRRRAPSSPASACARAG